MGPYTRLPGGTLGTCPHQAGPRGTPGRIGHDGHMPTPSEREAQRRQEKLDDIERQQRDGTLVVRKMTDEERAANPKPPPRTEGDRRRRRSLPAAPARPRAAAAASPR